MEAIELQIQETRRLISKGLTEDALELLLDFLSEDAFFFLFEKAVLISAQYHKLQHDINKGLAQSNSELNNINNSILTLLNEISYQKGRDSRRLNEKIIEIYRRCIQDVNNSEIATINLEVKQMTDLYPNNFEIIKLQEYINTIVGNKDNVKKILSDRKTFDSTSVASLEFRAIIGFFYIYLPPFFGKPNNTLQISAEEQNEWIKHKNYKLIRDELKKQKKKS
jgi:hypothetical protein